MEDILMKGTKAIKDEALDNVTGGKGQTCALKFCKYCGDPMEGKRVGATTIYECKCGAKYDPRLAQPWSK